MINAPATKPAAPEELFAGSHELVSVAGSGQEKIESPRMSTVQLQRWIAQKLRLRHLELIAELCDCRSIIKAS